MEQMRLHCVSSCMLYTSVPVLPYSSMFLVLVPPQLDVTSVSDDDQSNLWRKARYKYDPQVNLQIRREYGLMVYENGVQAKLCNAVMSQGSSR